MSHLVLFLSVLLLFFASLPVSAATPTINCHCFQDRAFDPASPMAADDYFLATTQNSLLAAAFGINKRDIVKSKMGGSDADHLWVVYYLSGRSGVSDRQIAGSFDRYRSWRQVVDNLPAGTKLDNRFAQALDNDGSESELAGAAMESVLMIDLAVEASTVATLRSAGAGRKEMLLAILLEMEVGVPAIVHFNNVSSGKVSWGQLVSGAGIEPKTIEQRWRDIIRARQEAD